ncbi:MAG TPA: hybrid sensor histidine kinase/response regulator [Rhodocyclaceae bacterium]|nr:hybrid sensor histidine kinase/response regulator [Rhodocyclaceae bacterium]
MTSEQRTVLQDLADKENAAVEAEQARAYFAEGNGLNLAGAVVLSLIILVVYDRVPAWTWAPVLPCLYLVTLARGLRRRLFMRRPEARSGDGWMRGQMWLSALAGACWGFANTAMLAHLPVDLHLFILTVACVSAASASAQGFAHHHPSSAFVVASLTPPTIWLMTVGDRLHSVLAVMLLIFIPLTLSLGQKRNRVFVEAQRMRFRNEALAAELLRQRDVAHQAREAKARFLAAASHDLRQPMQALAIFLDLLRQEPQGARTTELLGLTQQAVDGMNSLLGTLLDISKLDAGVVKANRRVFAVQDLLDGMAREFRPLTERKDQRLRVVPCSATIDSDPVLLSQIVRNLVANAVRYTPPSGRILIGCRRGPGTLRIEVIDTGIGIAADHQQAVFREFFQVGNKERNRERGLGLGLAIVERIGRLLDHPLTLRSRPGAGSCFAVTVPRLADAEPAPPPAVEAPRGADELAGLRVVVIDDDESILTGLRALLQSWGCEVVVADSAAAALERIEGTAGPVDAVISDLALGGGASGIDAIAALRGRCGARLPALLLTGDTSQGVLNAAKQAGLLMLHKPIKPARLRAALAGNLRGAEPAEELDGAGLPY